MSKTDDLHHSNLITIESDQQENLSCLITPIKSLRPGMICPHCKAGKIEYNGLLNLVCPNCGLTEAGAST